MKKLILFISLFMSLSINAQWNEDLSQNLLISQSTTAADLVQVKKAAGDKTYICWLSWEEEIGYVKLQLLDKDGNELFEKGGMYVTNNNTPTWSTGYGFDVTEDGCAVIVYPDTRNGKWQPYAYKISQDGEQMWGVDGIALLNENEEAGLAPTVCVSKSNNIYVSYTYMSNKGTYNKVTKLQNDGSRLWGANLEFNDAGGAFRMVPSGNDGFIAAYYNTNANCYSAMKFTANGEEAWDNVVEIDESGSLLTTAEPYIISDGKDGLITSWRYSVSQFETGGMVQWIDKDGRAVYKDGGLMVYELSTVALDKTGEKIYVSYPYGENEQRMLYLCQYGKDGTEEWNVANVGEEIACNYAVYGIVPLDEGLIVVYRNAAEYNTATIEYSRFDSKGNFAENNVTISNADGDKGKGEVAVFDNQFVVGWSNHGEAVFAQNVILPETNGIESVISSDKESSISVTVDDNNTVSITNNSGEPVIARIYMVDILGNKVADMGNRVLNAGDNNYSSEGIARGMYIMVVETGNNTYKEKVII